MEKLRPVGLVIVDEVTQALKANASFIERRTTISSVVEVVPKSRPRLFRVRLIVKYTQPDDDVKIEPLTSRFVSQYMSTDDRLYVYTDFVPSQPLSA